MNYIITFVLGLLSLVILSFIMVVNGISLLTVGVLSAIGLSILLGISYWEHNRKKASSTVKYEGLLHICWCISFLRMTWMVIIHIDLERAINSAHKFAPIPSKMEPVRAADPASHSTREVINLLCYFSISIIPIPVQDIDALLHYHKHLLQP
jgi:hypothetical protein